MDVAAKYTLADAIQFRDYRDCGVLIDVESREFFELNATATLIIRGLKDRSDSPSGLWQRSWMPSERSLLQSEEDVADFLGQLLGVGLIRPVGI